MGIDKFFLRCCREEKPRKMKFEGILSSSCLGGALRILSFVWLFVNIS